MRVASRQGKLSSDQGAVHSLVSPSKAVFLCELNPGQRELLLAVITFFLSLFSHSPFRKTKKNKQKGKKY